MLGNGHPKASTAIGLPTLLLTPAHCNTHRQKRAAKPHHAAPSPSCREGQNRWVRALNEFQCWSWQSSPSCLSWTSSPACWRPAPVPESYFPQPRPGPTGRIQTGGVVCKGVRSKVAHRGGDQWFLHGLAACHKWGPPGTDTDTYRSTS